MAFEASKVAFHEIFIAIGFDSLLQRQAVYRMVGGIDPLAKLTHGPGNGRLFSRTGQCKREIVAFSRQVPTTICTHRTLVDVFLDLYLQQPLDAKRLENGFDRFFDLRVLRQARFPFPSDGKFSQRLLCLLQALLPARLSGVGRSHRLNEQTTLLPAKFLTVSLGGHILGRFISLSYADAVSLFVYATDFDQLAALSALDFYFLTYLLWRCLQGRKRAQVKIPLRSKTRAGLQRRHFAISHIEQPACWSPSRTRAMMGRYTDHRRARPRSLLWPAACPSGSKLASTSLSWGRSGR